MNVRAEIFSTDSYSHVCFKPNLINRQSCYFSTFFSVYKFYSNVLFTLNPTTHSSKTLLCVVRINVNKTLLKTVRENSDLIPREKKQS